MNRTYIKRIFLTTFLIPIVLVSLAMQIIDSELISESWANFYSTFTVLICWGLAYFFLFSKFFTKRFFTTLTVFLILRIVLNLVYLYFFLDEVAGASSSSEFHHNQSGGDAYFIYASIIYFLDALKEGGWIYAIFGNYYRSINNPGIPIIYGSLFKAFGHYTSVEIPWSVLYSAFASLLVGLLGMRMKISDKLCQTAVLLTFFMPGFFIFRPLLRNIYIIFVLVLSAYTAYCFISRKKLSIGIALVILVESLVLFSLRRAYLFVPPLFAVLAVYYCSDSSGKTLKRVILVGIITFIASITFLYDIVMQFLVTYNSHILYTLSASASASGFISPFKQFGPLIFYPAAMVYSLFTPMPWWQNVPGWLLAYQIFYYPQTWFLWTVIIALIYSWRLKLITREDKFLITCWLIIFLFAILGSRNFAAGYIQIATPMLILPCIKFLHDNKSKCILLAFLVILFIHSVLLVKAII